MQDDSERAWGGLVAAVDQVLEELVENGMAWKQRIRPCQVGVDPSNRDGVGVNVEDVHALGADILYWGWSWSQVASAVCVEEAPGSHAIADFNRDLAAGCDALPGKGLDQIRYGSLACSHTNMFLRCLAEGVKSSDAEISEGGRLCLDKVERRDAEFGKAARQGLEWLVLSSKVARAHPTLLTAIQRARNAPQAIARAEHEVQVMLRMHRMAEVEQRRTGNVDWAAIRRSVAPSAPTCQNYLKEISVFIAMCGGGTDGAFLRDLHMFHRQFVNSKQCSIRGPFLQALAQWQVKAPFLKVAVLKAQYSSPAKKINKYNEPISIGQGDFAKASRRGEALALEAEVLLSTLRGVFQAAGLDKLPRNVSTKLLSQLDVSVARFVLDKQDESTQKKVLTSLSQAARFILQEAKELEGWETPEELDDHLKLYPEEDSEEAPPKKKQKASTQSACVMRMQEYTAGELTDALAEIREKGFDLGSSVTHGGAQFIVSCAEGKHVTVEHDTGEGKVSTEYLVSEFFDKFALAKAAVQYKLQPGWPSCYMKQKAYVVHLMKLRIMHSLHTASASGCHGVNSVNVYEKPSRLVQAIGFHNKGSLVLVPNTMTVKTKTASDQVGEGEVSVRIPKIGFGLVDGLAGIRFVLSPMFSKDIHCAAWAVRPTPDAAKANMGWSTMKVSNVAIAEGPHERTRTSASAKSASGGEASVASASAYETLPSEFVLELPVMVNTKAVSNEEELLLHRPKVVDHDKKAKAVNLAKLITAKVNEKASSQ